MHGWNRLISCQALRELAEKTEDSSAWPDVNALRRARQAKLRHDNSKGGMPSLSSHESLGQWKEFLSSLVADTTAAWDWEAIADSEGTAVFLCKQFQNNITELLAQAGRMTGSIFAST